MKLGKEREQQEARRTLGSWSVGAPLGSGRGQAAGRRRRHQAWARPTAQSSCPAALGRHTWRPRKCHTVSACMPRAHMVTRLQGVSQPHTSNFSCFRTSAQRCYYQAVFIRCSPGVCSAVKKHQGHFCGGTHSRLQQVPQLQLGGAPSACDGDQQRLPARQRA